MNTYWIWFSRINKIGAKAQKKLLDKYKNPEIIWNLTEKELQQNEYLNKQSIEIILNKEYKKNLKAYEAYMDKNGINMITIEDKIYPDKLKNIYDSPVVLYVKGNYKILNNKAIAIIGSRNCTNYGKQTAQKFAYNLSKQKINIVAGLANGIDTYAHIGTIKAREKTIAVIGSGLDLIYPFENKKVAEKIIELGGAVISEYVIGTKPEKLNFPARNRIISGLSEGILVVEAREKSGTFITVDFALEQGKNVYAIPGNINNPTSKRNKRTNKTRSKNNNNRTRHFRRLLS